MTRKDYKLIAEVLRINRNRAKFSGRTEHDLDVVDDAISDMATELARDNPRFDRQKFLEATR